MSNKKILLLEFNELCPSLVHDFMEKGLLPNFKQLYEESQIFVTDAEEKPPFLEPWIQWVTVHTGIPYKEHKIFHLDSADALTHPQLWDYVSAQNEKVCVFGSMNVSYQPNTEGVILPDVWSTCVNPHPQNELNDFYTFIKYHVSEHTRLNKQLSTGANLKFINYLLRRGLSLPTGMKTIKQLLNERLTGKYHWRRAGILDSMFWDVFKWHYTKVQPKFATFFLNSTAHLQHMYWRNFKPEHFTVKPDQKDEQFNNAILFGYQEMDRIIGKANKLAGEDCILVLCTALSQQPCVDYDAAGGKHFYRFINIPEFLQQVNIRSHYEYAPVMSEQFQLTFKTNEEAKAAKGILESLKVNGDALMGISQNERTLYCGCSIYKDLGTATLSIEQNDKVVGKFYDILYKVDNFKSGKHHPDGILWVKLPSVKQAVSAEKVSLLSIAPTLLSLMGHQPPEIMKGERLFH